MYQWIHMGAGCALTSTWGVAAKPQTVGSVIVDFIFACVVVVMHPILSQSTRPKTKARRLDYIAALTMLQQLAFRLLMHW